MNKKDEKSIVDAFDRLYIGVRKISDSAATQEEGSESLAALRDAFLDSLRALPKGTDISTVLDLGSIYDLLSMLSEKMDRIAISESDEPGWNKFMDIIRDAIEV